MDIFIRNLASDISEDSLTRELRPHLTALSIHDWECQKPRNKSFAFLHFLEVSAGNRFLDKYGAVTSNFHGASIRPGILVSRLRPAKVSRLRILTSDVIVEKSNQAINTDILGHLKYQKAHRNGKPKVQQNSSAPGLAVTCVSLACGKIVFDEDKLTFASETRCSSSSRARFGRQGLVITIHSQPVVRLDFPYLMMEDVIINMKDTALTLILSQPPQIHVQQQSLGLLSRPKYDWERATAVPVWPALGAIMGHCLVYELMVPDGLQQLSRWLGSKNVVTLEHFPLNRLDVAKRPDIGCMRTVMAVQNKIQGLNKSGSALPYIILFQLERLVQDNYLHPATVSQLVDAMYAHVVECRQKQAHPYLTIDSIKRCLQKIPYPSAGLTPEEVGVTQVLADFIATEQVASQDDPTRPQLYGAHLPSDQIWVIRAIVTPTRINLCGPDPEAGNKILRKYKNRSTYFLRVSFEDEDGQDVFQSPRISNEPVYKRYLSVLQKGIQIAGRDFQFLGFSHSSLRAHSAWFVAPFLDDEGQRQDQNSIVAALGDFQAIRIPAKCAARIGQAFSETPYAINIFENDIAIHYISDVEAADGSVFSDGVGTISLGAAQAIWAAYPSLISATCFQIRWAGCKGMLSLDTRIKGKTINIRTASMMKFPSTDFDELGICDAATRPLRLVLNRQMIKILEDMGTNPEWFFAMQAKALRILKEVTVEAYNTATFLEFQLIGTNVGVPHLVRQLDRIGIDYRWDGFLKTVVEHVVLRELRLLKQKARIPVDQGITLFGVLDETEYLNEGEIYFHFDDQHFSRKHLTVRGPSPDQRVIVTRSPALHPGDIQLVTFKQPPSNHPLSQLRNCVAFSQKGARALPSKLSGGDLDGDIYNIIWDHDARPKRTFTPAEYPRVKAPELNRDVLRSDIAEFFVNFMKSDVLGLIANRHQIMADIKSTGTVNSECIMLAHMHSTAVDYSKTGVPVDAQSLPRAPPTRPDFLAVAPPLKVLKLGDVDDIADDESDDGDDVGMGRSRPKYHLSEKVLGKLYRSVDEQKIWKEDVKRPVDPQAPSVWDGLTAFARRELKRLGRTSKAEAFEAEAKRILRNYEDAMENLMWQFSDNPRRPLTEVEVFCGSVLNKTGRQSRRQRDASIKLKEETDRVMSWTVTLIRRPETSSTTQVTKSSEDPAQRTISLSLACIAISVSEDMSSRGEHGRTRIFQSFRVIAACCLIRELSAVKKTAMASQK